MTRSVVRTSLIAALVSVSGLMGACGDGRHFEHEPAEGATGSSPDRPAPSTDAPAARTRGPGLEVVEVISEGLTLEVHALDWTTDGALEFVLGATDTETRAPLGGLAAEHFSFTEDEVPLGAEALFSVERERALHVALVLDVSRSMLDAGADAALREGARALVESLPAGVEVALVPFATRYETRLEFTGDVGQVLDAVETLVPPADRAGQFTNLWGAIEHAAALLTGTLRESPDASAGGRVVVAFTDGRDNVAESAPERSAERLRAAGASLYAVGLGESLDREALQTLAGEGRYAETTSPGALSGLFRDIGARLGELARVRYTTPKQSGAHELVLEVRDGPRGARLKIRFDLG